VNVQLQDETVRVWGIGERTTPGGSEVALFGTGPELPLQLRKVTPRTWGSSPVGRDVLQATWNAIFYGPFTEIGFPSGTESLHYSF